LRGSRAGERRARGAGFTLYALHLWMIWGIALSNIFLGLATIAVAPARAWQGLESARRVWLLRALGALSLLFLLSVVFSYEPAVSLGELNDLFSLLPALLTLLYVRCARAARRVRDGLVALGALLAVWGLAQVWQGGQGLDLARRIPGPFSHYQTFAGVLLLCDLLALAALVSGPREPRRTAALAAALVLINLALFANLTRGSWVAVVLSLLFLVALRAPRWLTGVVPLLAVLAVLAVVKAGPVGERVQSIFDLSDESNYDRLTMVYAGGRMMVERPVFGLGPGVVEHRYPLYRHPTAPNDRRPHLHNSYLQLGAESGLPMLAAYLGLLAAALWLGVRAYRREGGAGGTRADLHLGASAALVAYTVAGLFEDNWTDTEVQRIALFVIALPFCLDPPREDS
jgi:O-antigen ligase